MTRAVVIIVALAAVAMTPVAGQNQAVFRAAVEGVSVNVSVRQGNQPIGNLTANDFELKDNGVLQAIAGLTFETLPIDLTLLLDASRSVEGARLQRLKDAVQETSRLLNPEDRIRLISLQHELREVFPFQPGTTPPDVSGLTARGGTSLFDGLSAAMMRQPVLDRRQLIIGYTDGQDTISSLDYSDVLTIAGRAEAVLYLVIPSAPGRVRSVIPALSDIASRTGGQLFGIDLDAPISESFARSLDDFRKSYVLRYTPAGVPLTGWHEITVTVKGANYDVRARKGWGEGR